MFQRLFLETPQSRIVVTHSDHSEKISYNGSGAIRPRRSSGSRLSVLSVNIMASCVPSEALLTLPLCSLPLATSQNTHIQHTFLHKHTVQSFKKFHLILFGFRPLCLRNKNWATNSFYPRVQLKIKIKAVAKKSASFMSSAFCFDRRADETVIHQSECCLKHLVDRCAGEGSHKKQNKEVKFQ